MRSKAITFRHVLDHPERTISIVAGFHLHTGENSKLALHALTEGTMQKLPEPRFTRWDLYGDHFSGRWSRQ